MNNIFIKTKDIGDNRIEDHFKNKDLITIDDLIGYIQELNSEISNLQDEKQSIVNERDEYYKPRYRDAYELYGVSEKDFY